MKMHNMISLDFWKQVSLSWCVLYTSEQKKKTDQTMTSLADDAGKNPGAVKSLLDAIMGFEEDDDDGWN